MNFRVIVMLLLAMAGCSVAGAGTNADAGAGAGPVKAPHVTVEMVRAGPTIAVGGSQSVGFVFSVEVGWHVLWRNPGSALQTMRVHWTLPDGLTAEPVQYPTPERLPRDQSFDYGYEDSVAYPAVLHLASTYRQKIVRTLHASAQLEWLVCREVCVPGTATLSIDLSPVAAGTAVGSMGAVVGELGSSLRALPAPLPAVWRVQATSSGEVISLLVITGRPEHDAEFFPWDAGIFTETGQEAQATPDGVRFELEQPRGFRAPRKELHGLLKFGEDTSYEFSAPITADAASGGARGGDAPVPEDVWIRRLQVLSVAFLGGLLLNLSPLAYLVLLLHALVFVSAARVDAQQARQQAIAFVFGVATTVWITIALGIQFTHGWPTAFTRFSGAKGLISILVFTVVMAVMTVKFIPALQHAVGPAPVRHATVRGYVFGVVTALAAVSFAGLLLRRTFEFSFAQPVFVTFVIITATALGLALPTLTVALWMTRRTRT